MSNLFNPVNPMAGMPLARPDGTGVQSAPPLAASNIRYPAVQSLQNTANLTPEQTDLFKKMMTPEGMSQILSDPAMQAQLSQLGEGSTGAQPLPPLDSASSPSTNSAVPSSQSSSAETTDDFKQTIITSMLSSGLGLGLGFVIDSLMEGVNRNSSPLLKTLMGLERIPFMSSLNTRINQKLQYESQNGLKTKGMWSRLLSENTPQEILDQHFETYLGPHGILSSSLSQLKLPPVVMQHLQSARSAREIKQVLESDILHFFSENELGNDLYTLVKEGLKPRKPGLIPFMEPQIHPSHRWTVQELDYLLDRKQLLSLLKEATQHADPAQRLGKSDYQKLISALKMSDSTLAGSKPGTAFVMKLGKLLKGNSKLSTQLKTLLGMGQDLSYTAFQSQLTTKGKGHKPLWELLESQSQHLLAQPLHKTESKTLGQLQQHFKRFHISQLKANQALWKNLSKTLRGFVGHTSHIANTYHSLLKEEHALNQVLKNKGIGPTGRLTVKVLNALQRAFNGSVLKTFGAKGMSQSSNMLGRLAIILSLGMTISESFKSPEESRVPRMIKNVASVLAGFAGYEVGRTLIHELGLLAKFPTLARWGSKMILPRLPWSRAGFLTELVFPSLVGAMFSIPVERLSQVFFGDPDKIEQELQFKQDQQRALTSQTGLLDSISKGDFSKVPGYKEPLPEPGKPDPLTLTQVGLAPEIIEQNQLEVKAAANLIQDEEQLEKYKKKVWSWF